MEVLAAFLIVLGTAAASFAVAALGVVIRGFVLHKLWGWFVVGAFHVAPLGIVACWGLALILSFAVDPPAPVLELKAEAGGHTLVMKANANQRVLGGFVSPFLVLLLGYLVHLFL